MSICSQLRSGIVCSGSRASGLAAIVENNRRPAARAQSGLDVPPRGRNAGPHRCQARSLASDGGTPDCQGACTGAGLHRDQRPRRGSGHRARRHRAGTREAVRPHRGVRRPGRRRRNRHRIWLARSCRSRDADPQARRHRHPRFHLGSRNGGRRPFAENTRGEMRAGCSARRLDELRQLPDRRRIHTRAVR